MKPMRRHKQQLSEEMTLKLLDENTSGVLSLASADGEPYGVPLNYARDGGGIYFHWAKAGSKVDLLKENNRACFTVIAEDTIISEEYTSYFKSAMVFGRLELLEDQDAVDAMTLLIEKYSSNQPLEEKEKEARCERVLMVRLVPERISGKQAIEYV